jgi:hypothetical protein
MGEVIPFKRPKEKSRCPCGWLTPQGMSIELIAVPGHEVHIVGAIVQFNCPDCNRRLQLGQNGEIT